MLLGHLKASMGIKGGCLSLLALFLAAVQVRPEVVTALSTTWVIHALASSLPARSIGDLIHTTVAILTQIRRCFATLWS